MNNILVKRCDLRQFYKSDNTFNENTSRFKNIFPIVKSSKLAGIVADLIGDGHLQGNPKWRLDYTSKSKEELIRFEKEIGLLFGIKGKIRQCTTNSYGESYLYGINCKVLARSLNLCGVPTGNKVTSSFSIPNWILENKEFFREFVNRLYHCEGSVDPNGPTLDLLMHKEISILDEGISFFNSLKQGLLVYFDINSHKAYAGRAFESKRGYQSVEIRFRIKRKIDIKKFVKEIGYPSDKEKLERLNVTLGGNI
jgi:hypothetical protein